MELRVSCGIQMSNSLKGNYLTMSVMRHMWDRESTYTGKGKDGFLEKSDKRVGINSASGRGGGGKSITSCAKAQRPSK